MKRHAPIQLALWMVLALPPIAPAAPKEEPLTPKRLSQRLAAEPKGEEAEQLARMIRAWFGGKEALAQGPNPKVDGLEVAWAIEALGAKVIKVVTEDQRTLPLVRVGKTDVYAATFPLPNGTAFRWTYDVDGKRLGRFTDAKQTGGGRLELFLEDSPDSAVHSDVPKGKLAQQTKWKSKVFDGTSRDWWTYVPAQYKDDKPACVMVFQDGAGYKDFVSTVFDNLIAKGDMPVTVGVFIQPGTFEGGRSNRSFEYDTLSDQYARFLLEEILPEVEKTVKLRHDPESRAIAGISSGGICAWTVAWERPKEFSKVLSWVGSFTNIASGKSGHDGGHNYEAMIRKTPKKPIRVFLQDGANDLDNANGNWPLANQQMAKSLQFAGYDYQFVYGQGFHSNLHGRAILPDSLRWLWRDYRP
ncbi:MAG: alpha/beta hydrolase-fold protein [Isosphaeraceae bacterium]|nr:alpha/beta hydrolase-fold protein [Isosphaeraceae bacterium]